MTTAGSGVNETLWRGDRRLGEIVYRFPTGRSGGLTGLLKPDARGEGIEPFFQVRVRVAPGAPVYYNRLQDAAPAGVLPLRALSPEGAAGIPVSEQVVVRDRSGHRMEHDMICLYSQPVTNDGGPFYAACCSHGIEEVAWIVGAHRGPVAPDSP